MRNRIFGSMRLWGVLLLLALAALACNLGVSAPPTPTPYPTWTPFVFPTLPTIQPSLTPFPTIQPVPTQQCFPRTDWPIYYAQRGDTLSNIAARTGATTAQLVSANCLANPNLIEVGQAIRVPRQPVPPTPTRSPTPFGGQPIVQGVTVQPAIQQGNQYIVNIGPVNVFAIGVLNAVRVEFYATLIGTGGGTPQLIGSDVFGADGWSTVWNITSGNMSAQVFAVAYSSANISVQSPAILVVSGSSQPPTIQSLRIEPAFPVSDRPNTLGLKPGPVSLSAIGVSSAVRVVFLFMPDMPNATAIQLGEDANMGDGASYIWNVTGPIQGIVSGLVWAVAYNATGQTAQTASIPIAFIQ